MENVRKLSARHYLTAAKAVTLFSAGELSTAVHLEYLLDPHSGVEVRGRGGRADHSAQKETGRVRKSDEWIENAKREVKKNSSK